MSPSCPETHPQGPALGPSPGPPEYLSSLFAWLLWTSPLVGTLTVIVFTLSPVGEVLLGDRAVSDSLWEPGVLRTHSEQLLANVKGSGMAIPTSPHVHGFESARGLPCLLPPPPRTLAFRCARLGAGEARLVPLPGPRAWTPEWAADEQGGQFPSLTFRPRAADLGPQGPPLPAWTRQWVRMKETRRLRPAPVLPWPRHLSGPQFPSVTLRGWPP